MTVLGVSFGKVAARAFGKPFRDGGGGGEGVYFAGFSFLDFHDCSVVDRKLKYLQLIFDEILLLDT